MWLGTRHGAVTMSSLTVVAFVFLLGNFVFPLDSVQGENSSNQLIRIWNSASTQGRRKITYTFAFSHFSPFHSKQPHTSTLAVTRTLGKQELCLIFLEGFLNTLQQRSVLILRRREVIRRLLSKMADTASLVFLLITRTTCTDDRKTVKAELEEVGQMTSSSFLVSFENYLYIWGS